MCHQAAPRGFPEWSVAMSATSVDAGRGQYIGGVRRRERTILQPAGQAGHL
jgi:hypothetical protein